MVARSSLAGLLAAFVPGSLGSAVSTKVTPVEKVVELLKNLEKKIEAEGAEEAKQYDKYACFCKDQADKKLYNIETSTKKISKMSAKIKKLGSEIEALDGDIGGLSGTISGIEGQLGENQEARDGQHNIFIAAQADAANAISALKRAISALKDSKGALVGKANRNAAFSQVRAVALIALSEGSRAALSEKQVDDLNELASGGPEAYSYEYQSNGIISILDDLLKTFTARKLSLEDDEFRAKSAHELTQQGLNNEKKFAEKDKAEAEELRAQKSEEKESIEADRTDETTDKNADQNFLNVVTSDCQTKAELWDQRSRVRSSELTSISEAMEALKSGVAPNFKANKKLVGLQVQSNNVPSKIQEKTAAPIAASFLQVRGARLRGAAKETQTLHRVQALLYSTSKSLHSPVLSVAALRVSMAEDHFVKVRGIIKDLIERLESDASDEASHKSWCDQEMNLAVTKRDEEQAEIERKSAQISGGTAQVDRLHRDIAQLSAEIAELQKAMLEATTLREKEKADNENTIEMATSGKEAVDFALSTLKTFYEQNGGFLQFVPANSDREGLTVADRAPDIFDSEYKGAQDASKGILGLLEVIQSDFERTISTVTGEEETAAGEYDEFKRQNKIDEKTKSGSITSKNGEINGLEEDLVTWKDDLTNAKAGHSDAEKELSELHSQCIKGEQTYAQRVAAREKEIEALKEAHTMLEDWNK